MSNVLNEQTKQQVIALGRLGWSLRRIQKVTGVRRETAAVYLREAGVGVRSPGLWGHGSTTPAKEPVADLPSATATGADAGPPQAKPAIGVTTDFGAVPAESPTSAPPPSASACAVHRDAIEVGLSRGRNAMAIWQDLVDTCGFTGGYQSVKRFVRKLVGSTAKEACAVIETAPGEDYGKSRVMLRRVCYTGCFGSITRDLSNRLFP